MRSPLSATLLALILPMNALGQATSTTSTLGILQLMSVTMQPSQFPPEALVTFYGDVADFYMRYINIDTFKIRLAEQTAMASLTQNPSVAMSLSAEEEALNSIYSEGGLALLDYPSAYLSHLATTASRWPFSSALMSQASGVLLGYKSLVNRDLLNITASQAAVFPGMSISVSGAAATAGSTATLKDQVTSTLNAAMTGTTVAVAGQATSTSKALGVPAATGNSQLVFGAAAAVAGMLGVIML